MKRRFGEALPATAAMSARLPRVLLGARRCIAVPPRTAFHIARRTRGAVESRKTTLSGVFRNRCSQSVVARSPVRLATRRAGINHARPRSIQRGSVIDAA